MKSYNACCKNLTIQCYKIKYCVLLHNYFVLHVCQNVFVKTEMPKRL